MRDAAQRKSAFSPRRVRAVVEGGHRGVGGERGVSGDGGVVRKGTLAGHVLFPRHRIIHKSGIFFFPTHSSLLRNSCGLGG